jgi:hypothetical protein
MPVANCGIAGHESISLQRDEAQGMLRNQSLYPEIMYAPEPWLHLLWVRVWLACRHTGFSATRGGIVVLVSFRDSFTLTHAMWASIPMIEVS